MSYLTLEEEIELHKNMLTESDNWIGDLSEKILVLNDEYKRRKLEACQAPRANTAQCLSLRILFKRKDKRRRMSR